MGSQSSSFLSPSPTSSIAIASNPSPTNSEMTGNPSNPPKPNTPEELISKNPTSAPIIPTTPPQKICDKSSTPSTVPLYELESCTGCNCIPQTTKNNSLSNEFRAALCPNEQCDFSNLKKPPVKNFLDQITNCHSTMLSQMGSTCSSLKTSTCPATAGLIQSLNKLSVPLRNYAASVLTMVPEAGSSYQSATNENSVCHSAMVGKVIANRFEKNNSKLYLNPDLGRPPSYVNSAMARSQFAMSLFPCEQQIANSPNYQNYVRSIDTFCKPANRNNTAMTSSIVGYLLLGSSASIFSPEERVNKTTNFVAAYYHKQQKALVDAGTPSKNWKDWMGKQAPYSPMCNLPGLPKVNISTAPQYKGKGGKIKYGSYTVFY